MDEGERLEIRIEEAPDAALVEALDAGLSRHALPHTGRPGFQPVALVVRDREGTLVAGASLFVNWNWLFVDALWVDDRLRGRGWGRRLMTEVERLGRERGCEHLHLDTFSFQARPFYEKLGFEVFAVLEDYPPGHQRFYLRKRL